MNKIYPIPAFSDNYIWAIHDVNNNNLTVVDPGDAKPVLSYLEKQQIKLSAILITHKHWDHIGGVTALKKRFPEIEIYGPQHSSSDVTHPVQENDEVHLKEFQLTFKVLETPGHTLDHIAYFGDNLLFCGDTLFSAGCGRVFEGTMPQMYASLKKLVALPDETLIFCAHEYTLNNLQFALTIEPQNKAIQKQMKKIEQLRQNNQVSLPSTIGAEKTFNPFVRCEEKALQHAIKEKFKGPFNDPIDFFTQVRQLKDKF